MHGAHHHHGGLELIDQTLDTAIVHQRAEEMHEKHQQQMKKLVDGDGPAPLAGAQSENDVMENRFKDKRILYDSLHRGTCYTTFAWMWCGCFEPKYKITASYAIGEEWHGCCLRVTDSMAYENVDDVQRKQGCCVCLLSCCPCCPCFNDMADVVLMGHDESHKSGWKLKRLHRSTQIFDQLTRIVQATNKHAKKKEKH